MDTRKMREQFESWALQEGYNSELGRDGHYQFPHTRALWRAWQASRQQLEVKLPETEYFGDSWSGGYAITRENVVDALEEQGLQVAP